MDNLDLKALYPVEEKCKVMQLEGEGKWNLCVLTPCPNRIHCLATFDDYFEAQYACISLRGAILDIITSLEVSIDEISRNKRS